MRRSVGLLCAAVLGAIGVALLTLPQSAGALSRVPSVVNCIAPETGAKGPTGPQGATGATGPTGPTGAVNVNGPARELHVRSVSPPCTQVSVVCLEGVSPGVQGVAGPTGATGPAGSSGPVGGPRRTTHLRAVDPCAAFDPDCTYFVVGLRGDTGPVGATGVQGAIAAPVPGGPARGVHRGIVGSRGSGVTFVNCDLPNTGGGSLPVLPYAMVLMGLGAAVVGLAGRRGGRAA